MKIAWVTDIHINFLDKIERLSFYESIMATEFELMIISGDIAEAPSVCKLLTEMAQTINKPIYFVLGNHDYYFGQIAAVQEEVIRLTSTHPLLHWLSIMKPVLLKDGLFIIGQDGWADGRYGDYARSTVTLNDSRLIADLFQEKCLGKDKVLAKMQQLADEDAEKLNAQLFEAIHLNAQRIIVVTHIPPFKENCLHEGKISDENFLPYFASRATGEVLLSLATEYPQVDFMVFCGHTHSASHYQPLANLVVRSGQAEYYKPTMQELIEIA
jgi:predicted phosphodiesterase